MADPNDESSSVGHAHPPQESQFNPGQSGNPAGRPKKPKDLNARIRDELEAYIPALINGHQVELTQKHAAVRALIRRAFAGDARALAILLQRWQASHPTPTGRRLICQYGKKCWRAGEEMHEGVFNPEVD